MDAKLESIVDMFRTRLDELVPEGSRTKSIALTHLETAQMYAEKARPYRHRYLRLYHEPRAGWLGYVEEDGGGVVAWISLQGEWVPPSDLAALDFRETVIPAEGEDGVTLPPLVDLSSY